MINKKCIILVGIPCSGKSSWAKEQGIPILSCDKIREDLYGKDYKFDHEKEFLVWEIFYEKIRAADRDFIVDNTNCKFIYINKIMEILKGIKHIKFDVELKYFDCSLEKAYFRNIIRWLKTGKWIPMDIINNFYKNYKLINKKSYESSTFYIRYPLFP